MWKDYFYFSKSQRIGIVVLIGIIFILLGLQIAIPYLPSKENSTSDTAFWKKITEFNACLKEQSHFEHLFQKIKWNEKEFDQPVLFHFNPNTLDSGGFVKLGLKPYIASHILKFRTKGGKFRTAMDFAKLYGLSKTDFERLSPYLDIPPDKDAERKRDSLRIVRLQEEALVVEVNGADTCALQAIKGLNAGCAKRIIRYRNALGGYAHKNQLKEVWGMNDSIYNKLKGHLKVDSLDIKKIEVNRAGIDKLRNHPYLNFYQAKAIYELRRNKGRLTSINDLKDLPELPRDVLEKIAPYLDFR